jgi:hypothetical protein
MAGLHDYAGMNPCPPELFLLPAWSPVHPNHLYCHTRYIYLAISFLYGARFRGDLGAITGDLRLELYCKRYDVIDFAAHRHDVARGDLYVAPSRGLRVAWNLMAAFERLQKKLPPLRALRRRALARCLQRIRATVIGASQFTVQVSGKTIYLRDPGVLPVHNVPVVHVGIDFSGEIDAEAMVNSIRRGLQELNLDPGARMAIAFTWSGDPEYSRLKAAGQAIVQALAPQKHRDELLLLMINGDVGNTFGHLLQHELNRPGKIMSIDGGQLQELDFVDVGEMMTPPGVVPVVIKSLLFS